MVAGQYHLMEHHWPYPFASSPTGSLFNSVGMHTKISAYSSVGLLPDDHRPCNLTRNSARSLFDITALGLLCYGQKKRPMLSLDLEPSPHLVTRMHIFCCPITVLLWQHQIPTAFTVTATPGTSRTGLRPASIPSRCR